MPRIKEVTLYRFEELDDAAKEKARDWWRQANTGDNYFSEHVTEEFRELLAACGFEIGKRDIEWSGFGNQGDGAAFAADWRADKCAPDAWLADRPTTYKDAAGKEQTSAPNKRWHDACAELIELASNYPHATAGTSNSRRGFNMSLTHFDDGENRDDETHTLADWALIDDARKGAAEAFLDAARNLAHEFWHALESEYEYQNSDEMTDETIMINEYEFTADGGRA